MVARKGGMGGFTLIELMVVMVILAVLSGVVIPRLIGQSEKSKIVKAKADISNLETVISAFHIDCGRYPSGEEGLSALVADPGISGWTGPYLKLVPDDPWGNPYLFKAPGSHLPALFDLSSQGPDKNDEKDDIGNWQR